MIDFHYWPTPNGWKVSIMLEECGLPYRLVPVNIGRGDQFKPEFLAISPNNRMPAIVDHDADGEVVTVFESGAILLHLAEKSGRFMPTDRRGRKETLEWLFWQVGNLGPMAGQLSHFVNYAQGGHPYSHQRYANEYNRCLGVLERRLAGRAYILDDYSIADMASFPWVLISKPLGQALDEFPNVARWREAIKQRPAVQRGIDLGKELRRRATQRGGEAHPVQSDGEPRRQGKFGLTSEIVGLAPFHAAHQGIQAGTTRRAPRVSKARTIQALNRFHNAPLANAARCEPVTSKITPENQPPKAMPSSVAMITTPNRMPASRAGRYSRITIA
jgi:GST-like protein